MSMKNILLPTTTILFFLLLLTRATEAKKVLDIKGNPLEVGSEYYITSAGIGWTGGIKRSSRPGQFCPLYAIEAPLEVDPGEPVKFLPKLKNKSSHIHTSSKLQIDSGFSAMCRDDGLWRLRFDALTQSSLVIASGVFDVPRTWFTIEEGEPDEDGDPTYKIATENGYLHLLSDDVNSLYVLGVTSVEPGTFLFIKKSKTYNDDENVVRLATN